MFSLKNISVDLIIKKYKLGDLSKNKTTVPRSTLTLLNQTVPVISFLDLAKNDVKCNYVFLDTKHNALPNTKYRCYWCRHDIEHNPIGIPLKYVFNEKIKNYLSELNNEIYVIYESTLSNNSNNKKIILNKNEYYLIDGVTCSWNCAMAFIKDNINNSKYEFSKNLLYKMYKKFHKLDASTNIKIKESPHWKLINVHGGHLTIDEFRNKFNRFEYVPFGTMNLDSKFVSELYEEKMTF